MAQLELLVSPPGTGKTTHCIDLFREEVARSGGGIDSCAYFVLPSREHADRIQNLVLKKGTPGLFNAHILSMNDLAPRLLRSSGASHPTDTIRRMILQRILDPGAEGGPEFGCFRDVRTFPGFHELLSDAMKEFNSNLIGVADFERMAQPLVKDPVFRAKYRDFSLVLKNYELALERLGLEEPEKHIERLKGAEELSERPSLVIFDGFYHFTRAQKFLLELLSRHARHVVVTLTLPDRPGGGTGLFEYPERTRFFLRDAGFREKRISGKSSRVQDEALLHLEKNLFLPEAAHFRGDAGSLTLIEAPSIRVEVEMIAREIRRLYRETSCHFSDVCLILRSVGAYEKIIRPVFADFGIPVHVHERHRLVQNGPAQTLYRFLKLVRDDWKEEDLFYLLKSSFFAGRVGAEEGLMFEAASFRENVASSRQAWLALASRPEMPRAVKEFIAFLAEWEDGFLASAGVRAFARRVEEFIFFFEGAPPDEESRREDFQAMACLKAILQSSRRYYEGAESRVFEARSFFSELIEAVEAGLFSVAPEGKNRVQVYDAVMALPKEYKTVFIAGLLEKSFPRSITEDPLFKDRERRALNGGGETFLEERLWRVAGERYFFYMAVTRAREKLYFSYPAYGADAKPTLPSFFIAEAARCFEPGAFRVLRKEADRFLPEADEWETAAEVAAGLGEALFREDAMGAGDRLFPLVRSRIADPIAQKVLAFGLTPPGASIRDPKARAEFAKIRNVFSATRLETYGTCAFRYFASKILRLNEPPGGQEAREMGTILHNTLDRFYKGLSEEERKGSRYLEDPAKMCESLYFFLEDEMEKSIFRNEAPYRRKLYLVSMKETLGSFIGHEKELSVRGLVPVHFEIGFGKDVKGVLDYLEIENGASPIRLTGKIDRIDVSEDGREALIIDYKRSSREYSIQKKLDKGLELQLPVYLLALTRLLGLEPLGAELRILRGAGKEGIYPDEAGERLGVPKGQRRSAAEFEKILKESENRIRGIVARLKDADISVRSKSCNFCEYDPVCRFEKWKILYEK